MSVTDWPVAQRQPTQIHRQYAATIQRSGQRKNQNAAADGQQWVETFGQFDVVDQGQQQPAAAQPKNNAHTKLL
ncbi:hypothetical protein D3C81_1517410 [compost metagenome]